MTQKNPIIYYIESIIEGSLGSFIVNFFLIPILFGLILLLPPVSLADRLLSIGYTKVDLHGGSIQDPSGIEVNFLPEGVKQSFRAKLNVIPRSSFLEGTAGNSLVTAAESMPPNLIMKSPYYRIQLQWGDTAPDKVLLIVPLPKEIDSPNLLDLYAWNGNSWDWLPNEKIITEGVIESQLDYLPESVVVMETHPINPSVSTDYVLGSPTSDNIKDTLVEVNPRGLQLGDNGKIEGDLQELPPEIQNSTLRIIPTIRNWREDGSIRSDLIDNLLIDATVRERHIRAIKELVQRNAYQGIDLDYRGISPDLRQEYTSFVEELSQALPDNKLLSIRVEFPKQVSAEAWDSGAYDWQAIGHVADIVKVPTSPDPRAYTQGGQMETLLDWAIEQVNRYKIQLILSTRSTEEVNGSIKNISYQQALGPIGSVAVIGENDVVLPGQQLDFTLTGLQESTGIQFDQSSGAYWYAYLDDNDVERTIFLENAASIARKLQFVAEYNLRGVAIENLLDTNNDVQIWDVIRQFLNLVIPPVESQFSVVWQVQNQDGGVVAEDIVDLSNPSYKWTVPEEGSSYEVAAAIASSRDSAVAVPRGSVAIAIATLTPTPTPTALPTATPEPTATPRPTATPEPVEETPAEEEAPASDEPPPIPSAVGDLPFAYGVQADPRGNSAANIGLIKGMGFNWVKFQMAWKDVESSPSNYSWGFWDEVIGQYSANGIKVLLSIPKAPDWARPPDDDKSVEGPPQDPNTYANFVGQVAGRYAGKVQAIEVWNEQNLYYEAGGQGRINPAAYTELLKASYNAIKAANPDMIVVAGALTPTGAPPPVALDDLEYLRQMYANGAKGHFDAIGAHPSGFANPPDALYQGGDFDPSRGYDDHRSFFFRNTMEEYRRIMVENGDESKTIWPTEFGWPVWRFTGDQRFVFAQQNSEAKQAEYTVRAYQMAREWGWVGTMFLWNLDYNITAANSELANFGIAGTQTYDALANMPK